MSANSDPLETLRALLGNRIAPPRFVLFVMTLMGVAAAWHTMKGGTWGNATVIGFDIGVTLFAVSLWPLTRDHTADQMRLHSRQNDANRFGVLLITGIAVLAVMTAITAELPAAQHGDKAAIFKLVVTLALGWVFLNLVFMIHYAHMHYTRLPHEKSDVGGFEFIGTPEPDYWDFLYFAFTAGMSFATSDVNITRGAVRRVVVLHCLLAFLFNIGALAFSINVLAGASG
ncbi:MAG: DUF1345 domain-containing protein [Novosphingobium sp.]